MGLFHSCLLLLVFGVSLLVLGDHARKVLIFGASCDPRVTEVSRGGASFEATVRARGVQGPQLGARDDADDMRSGGSIPTARGHQDASDIFVSPAQVPLVAWFAPISDPSTST
eukprot:c16170_g1_i1.p1 GENE.c16170_g1_i1~~c16170_g1_i1.p1  ORF type:complete len:113 (-),score=13.93 c16170_g1_i1:81-419(-)